MIQTFFNSMITLMMAKFMLNDVPHAVLGNPGNPISNAAYRAFARPLLRNRSTAELVEAYKVLSEALPDVERYEIEGMPKFLKYIVRFATGKGYLLIELIEEELRGRMPEVIDLTSVGD